MHTILVPATSLTLGIALSVDEAEHRQSMPVAAMNFPRRFAELLIMKVLGPYARPENFVVHIDRTKAVPELAVYCAVDTPEYIPLPAGVVISGVGKGNGFRYIIGNEADMRVEEVERFERLFALHGYFYLACGSNAKEKIESPIITDWRVLMSGIHLGSMKHWLMEQSGLETGNE